MININEIVNNTLEENAKSFAEKAVNNTGRDEFTQSSLVYKALMDYSSSLLAKYHQSLKEELTKHDIEI